MHKFFLSVILSCLMIFASPAYGQTLTKNADMDFGALEYSATHSGTLQLGTNGIVTVVGGVGISHDGTGNAGNVTVTGITTNVVEIKCITSGSMRLGNRTVNLQNIEVAIDTGVAYGAGNACQGTKNNSAPATTVDLSVNPSPDVLMGAEAVLPTNLNSGTFTTTAGGAKPITLRVIYQ